MSNPNIDSSQSLIFEVSKFWVFVISVQNSPELCDNGKVQVFDSLPQYDIADDKIKAGINKLPERSSRYSLVKVLTLILVSQWTYHCNMSIPKILITVYDVPQVALDLLGQKWVSQP